MVEDIEKNLFISDYEIGMNYEKNIMKYICINPEKNLKLSNIFAYETISKLYMTISVISPQKYIVLRKMNIGREFLSETNDSINSIGERLGYENVKTFNKNFKK